MNSPIRFNWLGVAFIDDNIPNKSEVEDQVYAKCEELRLQAQEMLDRWLEDQGLEWVMGVIIEKRKG